MDLFVWDFFPCTLQKARKLAPLVNSYCTEEDRAALISELHGMTMCYQIDAQEGNATLMETERYEAVMGSMAKPDHKKKKQLMTRIRKAETLLKRTEKIIELIERRKP